MRLYQSIYLEIDYEETHQFLEIRWLLVISNQECSEAVAAYLAIIENQQVKRVLGDYRLIGQQDPALEISEAPLFFPLTDGLEKMAKVMAAETDYPVHSTDGQPDNKESQLPFLFRVFTDYQLAKAWVLA